MNKKFLTLHLILCITICLFTMPTALALSGSCGDNLTWSLSGGVLTIDGSGIIEDGDWGWKNLIVNSLIISDDVTGIGNYAFESSIDLTDVHIGKSVKSIGDFAFEQCYNLVSIEIPNNVTSIGKYAFYGCSDLTDVKISNNVTALNNYTFYMCTKLKNIDMGNGVTTIGNNVFSNCNSLTGIVLSDNLKTIKLGAFSPCISLETIHIPANVSSIYSNVFQDCSSLTSITVDEANQYFCSENGVLFNKDKTVLHTYPIGNTRSSYDIPHGVTTIGEYAFYYCKNLTKVTASYGLTTIGSCAFFWCDNITDISLPGSLSEIADYSFLSCNKLTAVNYSGSESDWNNISMSSGNTCLTSAVITYVPEFIGITANVDTKQKLNIEIDMANAHLAEVIYAASYDTSGKILELTQLSPDSLKAIISSDTVYLIKAFAWSDTAIPLCKPSEKKL